MNTSGLGIGRLLSLLMVSAVMLIPSLLWLYGVPSPAKATTVLPPAIAQIRTMSKLATLNVHITDSIEGESPDWKIRWMVHGESVVGVDLSKASYVLVDAGKHEALLSLPDPHLISSRIDHDRSQEMSAEARYWVPLSSPKALRDEVWKAADRKIAKLSQEPGYFEQARVQAERSIAALFDGMGWKVRFQWQGDKPVTR